MAAGYLTTRQISPGDLAPPSVDEGRHGSVHPWPYDERRHQALDAAQSP